jgi:hypothetical protein
MLSYRELASTSLTKEVGDALMFTMRSVSDQGMDPFIGHKVIITKWVGTKVIVGADLLFPSSITLGLTIRSERCFRWRHCLCISCLAIRAILFTFWLWTAGFEDLAEDFFLVINFQIVFRRGRSTSTTKINTYEDCLFKC